MGSAQGGENGQQRPVLPPWLAAAVVGGGEMGRRLGGHDWTRTDLGPPGGWPTALSHAVSLMLSSAAPIVIFWGDDHLAFYNDAYLPTIGDKHPAAIGRPAREHWSETWHVLAPLLERVRRTGESYQARDHPFVLDRHGFLEDVHFDITYDPLRAVDDDGAVGGVLCLVNETTARVVGERRLRVLAELGTGLAGAAGGANDLGTIVADVLDRHRTDVPLGLLCLPDGDRPAVAGVWGVDAAGLRADPAQLVAAAGPAPVTVPVADLVESPGPDVVEQALILPVTVTDEPVGALVVGVSRRVAFGDEYRAFLDLVAAQISGAVSRQLAYEQERVRAAELAALDRAKTNFFANVSHEFRTPLTLVLGPVEEMLADTTLDRAHTERLTVLHRNALRLLKLVNTVLDFSRLESGRRTAHYQPTDLADYTTRLVSTFRSAVERAGLRLVVEYGRLPALVHVDREMWEKVVFNLLSNAVKFTFDGEIRVRIGDGDGMVHLRVTDTGVGIAPDELPHVFDRFHRVSGARARTHEGTGIGLALVKELVEMHGGRVEVRSRPDEGSTFTVTVPFGTAHLPPDRVVETASPLPDEPEQARLWMAEIPLWAGLGDRPAPGSTVDPQARSATGTPAVSPRPGGRILLVDDNADLRDHVTRLLHPSWEVVAVADGVEALALAVDTPFDLVLTDVMMPRLDGFGLVTTLRADPRTRHVPIVLLSARAGPADAVAGLSVGADDYLTKPFSGQELIARVRANVELGQLRGQIIRRLRGLADAAVAVNTARSTNDVLQVAAGHALTLAEAARVTITADEVRYEADSGATGTGPPTVVPLTGTTDEPLGELRVWHRDGERTDTERATLTELARLIGVRLENAQLYEAEHHIATTLQHSLLPRSLPKLPGAVIAGRYLAGTADVEVGGDWYDVIGLDDDSSVLVIGDVVGKGVRAAAAMGQLRNALRAYLLEGFDPGEALTRLNRLVGSAEHRSFATVVCLWFCSRTGRLRYASAGHPSPLLIRGDDVVFLHDRALGPPVGAIPGTQYRTAEGELPSGARLLLFTDGLIEDREIGIDAALAQLRAEVAGDAEHVADLVDRVVDRVGTRRRRDDVAVLALEATDVDRFTLRLPADPTRLSVLRKRLEDFLSGHAVSETDLFDLTVAISEAAANAIEHPVEPREAMIYVEVTVVDRTVVATVRDTGRWRESTGSGFRGRGLSLIEALGDLSVRHTEGGTELTLRRRLQP
ncbi:SpoIIE family protein phosphatase [Micromonospora sp. SH-82]|uniref:SpoIIE family protein phosphatase n=1 Tax=Micromonospora sp. SH-82 TaxID=3132938 RepID=UPI003EBD687C